MPPVHTVKCVTGACTPAPNMATLWLHFGMCHWHLYSCTQHGHSMAALWNVSLAPVLLHPTWPLYGCTLKCVTGTCTPAPNMATLLLPRIFYTVFFNNQTYSRFFEFYSLARSQQGRIHNLTFLMKSFVAEVDPVAAADVVRFANAAHVLNYVGISDEYEADFFIAFNAEHNLLNLEEMQRMQAMDVDGGGAPAREMLVW